MPRGFKRVVLGLQQSAVDRAAINLAAELAELLSLHLYGLFIEEPHISGLATLPYAREFRILRSEWHPIEAEHLAREFDLAALGARRLFTEAAAVHRVACEFEVVKASIDQAIHSFSRSTDILIIAEPRSAVDRITGPFSGISSAAMRSKASVLFVPRRVARMQGQVIAIATAPTDSSIDAAFAIAAAAKEKVTILAAYDETLGATGPTPTGMRGLAVETVRVPKTMFTSDRSIASILEGAAERLIVLTRGATDELGEAIPAALASLRQVPVLIVEPMEEHNN
jgi:hypothetical protein